MTKGIKTKKNKNFNEWYNQAIIKSGLAEYSQVSGFMVFKPLSISIWERIQEWMNEQFKQRKVQNAYFPLLIPQRLLSKESEHVEGFTPEVAWVTQEGSKQLNEKLAVRPTSETIMYDSFKKWIRSWRDLPLKINQWCSVVRMEFKDAKLFLRTREFLWQEGHTVFATKKEAEEDVLWALNVYKKAYEELLAIPVTLGKKTEKEKFAGADYTTTVEITMPDGKVIQGATSHHLGQNFAKAFEIKYYDKNEKEKTPYQNSWGFTTRSIGIMVAVHGDDKGIIIPPRVAPTQIIIIPIITTKDKEKIIQYSEQVLKKLREKYRAELDDREEHTPGYKFNEWELKGVPLRIEIGINETNKQQVTLVRRDNNEKETIPLTQLKEKINETLEKIHKELYNKALKLQRERTKKTTDYNEFKKLVEKNRVLINWCGEEECEEKIKQETGAKSSCIPFNEETYHDQCLVCGKKSKHATYFAHSY